MSPNKETAYQFAVMLASGAPAREAIRYFLPEDSPEVLTGGQIDQIASRWLADRLVIQAVTSLQGKDWTDLSTEEKMRLSLDKTYVEMAYFLYSRNYVELTGPERAKADTCRQALESKLAGTAGKLSAVEQFWADVSSGKVKLVNSAGTQTGSPSSPSPSKLGAGRKAEAQRTH